MVRCHIALCLLSILVAPAFVFADAATARKFIADAKSEIGSQNWDHAEETLKLAEAALDDATPAERDAIKKEIAQARTDIVTASAAIRKRPFMFKVKELMENAKRYMGQPREFNDIEKQLNEVFTSDDGKLFLQPADIESMRKELATLRKMSDKQAGDGAIKSVKEVLEKAEREMPAKLKSIQTPDAPDQIPASRDAQQMADELTREMAALPDTAAGKELRSRCQKLIDAHAAACATGDAAEFLKRMQTDWITNSKQFEGWQSEPDAPAVTELFGYSDAVAAFNAPKTIQMIRHANRWLEGNTTGEQYDRVKDVPAIKEMVEKIRKDRDAGLGKMEDRAQKVVAALEGKKQFNKNETDATDRIRMRMEDNLPGSSKSKALADRVKSVIERVEQTVAANEKARKELEEKMTAAAREAWPKLSAHIKADEISDPEALTKGQSIRITNWQNRMAWDYRGGSSGYDYGVTVNGIPVVGFYEPHVRKAVSDTAEKLGWGDTLISDRMDVIAVVTGRGKVERRVKLDVRDRGGSSVGELERWEPVDCVIVKVIAMRGGPIAVAPDGAVTESGAIAPVGASAGLSIGTPTPGGLLGRFFWTMTGLACAAAAFAKARPQLAAQTVGAQGSAALTLVNRNLTYIGLAAIALGAVWMLTGWVYRDLLPAAAVIAGGAYLAADLLKGRGVLKDPQHARLASLGAPIAVSIAAVMLLHLLAGGLPLI